MCDLIFERSLIIISPSVIENEFVATSVVLPKIHKRLYSDYTNLLKHVSIPIVCEPARCLSFLHNKDIKSHAISKGIE